MRPKPLALVVLASVLYVGVVVYLAWVDPSWAPPIGVLIVVAGGMISAFAERQRRTRRPNQPR